MEDTQGYKEMLRMDHQCFTYILSAIEKDITPGELEKGGLKPIHPDERLTLILRFLATGKTYRSLSFQFRISRSAISYIVQEVCSAIMKRLSPLFLNTPNTEEEWLHIADTFNSRWNFSNAIGAIDGKHVTIHLP